MTLALHYEVFKNHPTKYIPEEGVLSTASKNGTAITSGTETARFGNLVLPEVVPVPNFAKNL